MSALGLMVGARARVARGRRAAPSRRRRRPRIGHHVARHAIRRGPWPPQWVGVLRAVCASSGTSTAENIVVERRFAGGQVPAARRRRSPPSSCSSTVDVIVVTGSARGRSRAPRRRRPSPSSRSSAPDLVATGLVAEPGAAGRQHHRADLQRLGRRREVRRAAARSRAVRSRAWPCRAAAVAAGARRRGDPVTAPRVDPITLGVVWGALQSIAVEVGTTVHKTAYSEQAREGQDFSVAVFDPAGPDGRAGAVLAGPHGRDVGGGAQRAGRPSRRDAAAGGCDLAERSAPRLRSLPGLLHHPAGVSRRRL